MSIWHPLWDTIQTHEAADRLRRLLPRSPRVARQRAIFVLPELHDLMVGPHSDRSDANRYAALRARLEVFIGGDPITNTYLKALRPTRNGVWEIVNKKPKPSLRVFGLFVTRDVFIATHHQRRDVLGGFQTPMWKEEIRRARHEWTQLFNNAPLLGALHEVVSGAIYV